MSFKPIDSNRDEFRKYLERSGVIEALSKVLINLFHEQERPENAVDYLRINIGDALKDRNTIESLKQELAEARREIDELKKNSSHTVQTNTDGGGDAPILQQQSTTNSSAAAVAATENVEITVKSEATIGATSSTQSNTENVVIDEKTTNDYNAGGVVAEKVVETIKSDNEETNDNNIAVNSNEQQTSISAEVAINDEEPSKDPPKNAE